MAAAGAGVALGLIGAYFVGRAMQGMWFGVGAIDPIAFSAVALALIVAALLACIDPRTPRGIGRSADSATGLGAMLSAEC